MPLKVKLRSSGKQLTPYVSSVQTSGNVQKAFADQIGRPVGDCVRRNVRVGMPAGEIKRAVRECAKQNSPRTLSGPGIVSGGRRRMSGSFRGNEPGMA